MSKIDRINSELGKQIAMIIDHDLKHPAINGLVSVTAVDAASDLGYAKVRVSALGSSSGVDAVVEALNHSAGFIRKQLKSKMNIRMIPELTFYPDNNMEYAINISKKIDEVNKK